MEEKVLHRLLLWLAIYTALATAVAIYSGKAPEALAVLQNLVSGFAGAAFAVMRGGRSAGDE